MQLYVLVSKYIDSLFLAPRLFTYTGCMWWQWSWRARDIGNC